MKLLFILLTLGFGKPDVDSIPSFSIKFKPIPLKLDYDPHLLLGIEYFLNARRSIEFSYGNGTFLKLNDKTVNIVRAEFKTYRRPFNVQK
jgi:hypothetical protein